MQYVRTATESCQVTNQTLPTNGGGLHIYKMPGVFHILRLIFMALYSLFLEAILLLSDDCGDV